MEGNGRKRPRYSYPDLKDDVVGSRWRGIEIEMEGESRSRWRGIEIECPHEFKIKVPMKYNREMKATI